MQKRCNQSVPVRAIHSHNRIFYGLPPDFSLCCLGMVLDQCWTNKTMFIFAYNRCERLPHILTPILCEPGLPDLYHVWLHNPVTMLSGDCRHRLSDVVRSALTSVIALNDKWFWIIKNELFQSSCNPVHCFLCQRTNRPDAVLFFYFFRCVKNARTWPAEINLCVCSNIWL